MEVDESSLNNSDKNQSSSTTKTVHKELPIVNGFKSLEDDQNKLCKSITSNETNNTNGGLKDEAMDCENNIEKGSDIDNCGSISEKTKKRLSLKMTTLTVPSNDRLCLSPDSAINMSMITDLPESPKSSTPFGE